MITCRNVCRGLAKFFFEISAVNFILHQWLNLDCMYPIILRVVRSLYHKGESMMFGIPQFNTLDRNLVEKYLREHRAILRKTCVKELGLQREENWWYAYTLLEKPEFREYIRSCLKQMSARSLKLAILYLLVSEKGSDDEGKAIAEIRRRFVSGKPKYQRDMYTAFLKVAEIRDRLPPMEQLI